VCVVVGDYEVVVVVVCMRWWGCARDVRDAGGGVNEPGRDLFVRGAILLHL
jgi:hypothetical protein